MPYNSDTSNMLKLPDLPSHTVNENRKLWDAYDWSKGGEEWNRSDVWKSFLIDKIMLKYIKRGSTILEIGPGAGRWTEILIKFADRMILVDISETCLGLCKKRFKNYNNIDYNLTDGRLDIISNESVDYIWSYDVFVHVNPTDIDRYLQDIQRIIRPGGYAIIHHSGIYDDKTRVQGWRSCMNGNLFAYLVTKNGMKIVEQNDDLVNIPGDLISIFTKPSEPRTQNR